MRSPARRRELGAFYTPSDVADGVVRLAFVESTRLVCDPACGDGAFLLAAAHELERRGLDRVSIARDLLWGIDVDGDAVAAARGAIAEWAGVSPGDHVVVGDGLADRGWCGRFDVVVGNPPFLNQLERATARRGPRAPGAIGGPYADTSFLFVLAALDLVRDGGRVAMIQPQSLVAARDAAPIRAAVHDRAALLGLWTCDERVFDASVRVCAPVLERATRRPPRVRRWTGREFVPMPAVRLSRDGGTWSTALSSGDEVPRTTLDDAHRLGELITATAGFRDQFYGLAPFVVDEPGGDRPRLVTCGAIDPLCCRWGERPVRFAGRRWLHPRVDVGSIDNDALRRWVDARLVPKVVLATQTRVLEAAIDRDGTWVPSTPVIAVHAAPADLSRVAAVLLAPPVSAWAARRFRGVALSSDAIKLSARQVLDIPLPSSPGAWAHAADLIERGDLEPAAESMVDAYGAGPEVLDWWTNRRATRGGRRPSWRGGPPGTSVDAARNGRVASG
jgi:hypothetical protein